MPELQILSAAAEEAEAAIRTPIFSEAHLGGMIWSSGALKKCRSAPPLGNMRR